MKTEFPICLFISSLLFIVSCFSQNSDINDQLDATPNPTTVDDDIKVTSTSSIDIYTNNNLNINKKNLSKKPINKTLLLTEPNCFVKVYNHVVHLVSKFTAVPKVKTVLRNVGTCIVNGVMEIISYYVPAPFIPLVASAAGFIIPFEPVVMLKQRLPVTSYRRAVNSAVHSFLGTFDRYKFNDEYDDPYMTRRFNRRFMGDKTNGLSTTA